MIIEVWKYDSLNQKNEQSLSTQLSNCRMALLRWSSKKKKNVSKEIEAKINSLRHLQEEENQRHIEAIKS